MSQPIRAWILLILMLASSALAIGMRPPKKVAGKSPDIDLQTMIPRTFGVWREELLSPTQVVDPQQKESLDRIYSQLLTRTYINENGYRIMLSIAYGADQNDYQQVHKPEICYPAQGFILLEQTPGTLTAEGGPIQVTRLLTNLGQRTEPVTYWILIGDQVVRGAVQKKLVEIGYALAGERPDGLLFRVSSIDTDSGRANRMQDKFVRELLLSVDQKHKDRLVGRQQPGAISGPARAGE